MLKTFYFNDIIFNCIKKWILSKKSFSNSSMNKSSKELPDLVKNCQGGCGWNGDSSRKSPDTNCLGLRDQPCLHGA